MASKAADDDFELDFEDTDKNIPAASSNQSAKSHSHSGLQTEAPGNPKPTTTSSRIKESNVKSTGKAQHLESKLPTEAPVGNSEPQQVDAQEPAAIAFEGQGLQDLGSSKAHEGDEEFEYAFEGGKRAGPALVFQPKQMPAHLVTDVRQQQLGIVTEDDEEEDPNEGEKTIDVEAVEDVAATQPLPAHKEKSVVEEESDEDEDTKAQRLAFDLASSQPTLQSPPPPVPQLPAKLPLPSAHSDAKPSPNTPMASKAAAAAPAPATGSSWAGSSSAVSQLLKPSAIQTTAAVGPSSPRGAVGSSGFAAAAGAAAATSPRPRPANRPGALASARAAAAAAAARSAAYAVTPAQGSADAAEKHPAASTSLATGLVLDEDDLKLEIPSPDGPKAVHAYDDPKPVHAAPVQLPDNLEDEFDSATKQRKAEMEAVVDTLRQPQEPLMTYSEAASHFTSCEVDAQRSAVMDALQLEYQDRSWLQVLICWAVPRHPPRQSALYEQMVRLLCLAKMQLMDAEPAHWKLLASLFMAFTGNTSVPSRYGGHWADLGFQGQDPGTDLRGSGMLGLLQLYFLHHHNPGNAHSMYMLSRSVEQEFPLSIVSLNVTKWTIQAVRGGLLLQEAHRRNNLLEAANLFYVGTFYAFYQRWLNGRCTMRESGFILKEIEERCKKRVNEMLRLAQSTLTPPVGGGGQLGQELSRGW